MLERTFSEETERCLSVDRSEEEKRIILRRRATILVLCTVFIVTALFMVLREAGL